MHWFLHSYSLYKTSFTQKKWNPEEESPRNDLRVTKDRHESYEGRFKGASIFSQLNFTNILKPHYTVFTPKAARSWQKERSRGFLVLTYLNEFSLLSQRSIILIHTYFPSFLSSLSEWVKVWRSIESWPSNIFWYIWIPVSLMCSMRVEESKVSKI